MAQLWHMTHDNDRWHSYDTWHTIMTHDYGYAFAEWMLNACSKWLPTVKQF